MFLLYYIRSNPYRKYKSKATLPSIAPLTLSEREVQKELREL